METLKAPLPSVVVAVSPTVTLAPITGAEPSWVVTTRPAKAKVAVVGAVGGAVDVGSRLRKPGLQAAAAHAHARMPRYLPKAATSSTILRPDEPADCAAAPHRGPGLRRP